MLGGMLLPASVFALFLVLADYGVKMVRDRGRVYALMNKNTRLIVAASIAYIAYLVYKHGRIYKITTGLLLASLLVGVLAPVLDANVTSYLGLGEPLRTFVTGLITYIAYGLIVTAGR